MKCIFTVSDWIYVIQFLRGSDVISSKELGLHQQADLGSSQRTLNKSFNLSEP